MSGPAAGGRPLNAAQLGVWYAQRLAPASQVFNMGGYVDLFGPVAPGLLAATLAEVVAEDETTRLRFTEVDGVPCQYLAPREEYAVEVVDLRAEPDPVESALGRIREDMSRVPDLEHGPLFHHELFQVGPEHIIWYNRAHHLIQDGYSGLLLRRRAGEIYARLAAGADGQDPGTSFDSFWRVLDEQEAYEGSSAQRRDRAYWGRLMADAECPPGPGAAEGASYRIAREVSYVDRDTFERLREFSERAGVSWQQALIGAAVLHRHRWTDESDVLLSLPVTGRLGTVGRWAPGMTANVLPLRCRATGDETCEELVARVATQALRAQWHQRYDAAALLRDLGWPADGRRQFGPVINVLAGDDGADFAGMASVAHLLSTGGTAEDLAITVTRGPDEGLRVDFTVDAAYERVVDLAAQRRTFHRVIDAMTARPGVLVREVELLDAAERELVLRTWNDTSVEIPERSLGDLFEEQARTRPEHPAVIFNEHTLTYGQLNEQANQLAHHLTDSGLRRGDLAGVLLERGIDFAVTLLAIVKTGAGYAVLDPDFPDERLTTTATDAHITTLITDTARSGRISGPWSVIQVDTERETIGRHRTDNPGLRVTPVDVACVMFTSGSTGRPKGVLSSHHNLISTLTHQTYATFGPTETFLQCSPVSWDAFSLEFWGALLHGGTTILQPGQKPEPTHITHLTTHHPITMLQLSSSLFNYLTDEHPHTFQHTHTTYTGGEPASPTHTHQLQQTHPHLTITNGYGPAESMGFTTTHTITPTTTPPTTIPIGTPLTNKHAYILDTHLQPTPIGTTGELYLAGHGLAHGYLNQPTNTATHFIPNPYGPPGTRLYRTGDTAHWTPTGQLHYTGRTDTQIKIRGFRIEPTEIETTLQTHPHITQTAITTHTDHHNTPRLTAYITTTPGSTTSPQEIRAWLRARLPDHMVPSFITPLERMPLTPNGKLDKRALPVPAATAIEGRAPRTPLEEILCGLFADALASPAPLTIDDNFFDHGGHSLLAARLASRIRTTLDTDLTIRDIFLNPTPAALAELMSTAGPSAARPALIAAEHRPERLPLSFAQRRLWLIADLEERGTAYNVPLSVRLEGDLDTDALRAAFQDLMGRHEPLRTVFVPVEGEAYQKVLAPEDAPVAFERRRITAAELDAGLRQAAGYAFDLSAEPPLRVTLFDTGDGGQVLLVLLHHIATDGQSQRPLFGDLAEAYAARREGHAPAWTAPAVQYADHALWQRRTLGDAADPDSVLAAELAHWRTALAGLPEELGLTLDRPRPAVAGQRGGAVLVDFGSELYERTVALARAERCTPFMVLHAALAATLTRLGAGEDIPIGSPVAGRSDDAVSPLVGFFVNTLVLRSDTSGNPSFRELLARVRATDLDAFAHQEAPFDLVLEAVNPERSLSRHPLFQVCLALENGPDPELRLRGLGAARVGIVDTGSAKFDLEFLLRGDESGGLTGAVLYSSDIFDHATAERMVAAFRRLLEQVVADPALAVREVDLLDAAERELVLRTWNDTSVEIPERSLGDLFEEQARTRPEHPAVIFNEHTLTYGQLNEQANQLAHHLTDSGLRRGDLAGVLLERGIDFAVTLLAIVKTGAGYAVLDPDFPDERLTTTATDAHITTLITDTARSGRISGPWSVIQVDTERETIGRHRTDNPGLRVTPVDVACVMFTSGSTGRPKGVLSSHHNLISTLTHQTYATFGPTETFLQCSPVSWDAFSLEFWGALLHGGTTILQPGQKPEPTHITHLTTHHPITMLQLSSSLFNYLTDEHPHTFQHTHTTYTGGEPASPTHTHQLQQTHPHLTITNGYGPAESMGFTTTHTITPTTTPPTTIPIGTPLTNKHAYILDTHLQPTPIGTTGELYLAGHGLAHGYLNQPTNTATHFIPNPYGPPGTRLYRTGDTAHWTPTGQLHYTGRTDTQIKIRGFRIEPTEIETTLQTHPHITQTAITTHTDHHNTPRLTAYITTTAGVELDGREVREWLRGRLPDHMVPSLIATLERMPLTPNGKLDKKALPAIELPTVAGGRAPRTPLEEKLCGLFADALAFPAPLTIDDNFFDHGGHSLLAARLASRIRTTLDAHLTIRDIFLNPTPAALAGHIEALGAGSDAAAGTPARRSRPALRRRTEAGALLGP